MKTVLRSVDMAFCMFSVIPMPVVAWEKKNMKYMLCSLPLVGLVIGVLVYFWTMLAGRLGLTDLLTAAVCAALPAAVSGGVHLDGYADTVDAVSSHASPERKREILKDSHAGAFAIIWLCVYFLLYCACCGELSDCRFWLLIPALSRTLGAFAGTAFPSSGKEGLLKTFREGGSTKAAVILVCWWIVLTAAAVFLLPAAAVFMAAAGVLVLLYVRKMSVKEFGGMSGDLAGFTISVSELFLLFAAVLAEKLY